MPDPSSDAKEVRVTLRLPADLHAALRQLAERDDRSLNREIVALLRAAIPPDAAQQRKLLSAMPRYTFPRPTNRKPRGGG